MRTHAGVVLVTVVLFVVGCGLDGSRTVSERRAQDPNVGPPVAIEVAGEDAVSEAATPPSPVADSPRPVRHRGKGRPGRMMAKSMVVGAARPATMPAPADREQYAHTPDNAFFTVGQDPLSTFSIDVDTASYANVRRMITQGRRPPADSVRIEEMINYFPYAYAQPDGVHPFGVAVELAGCPWKTAHRLARIAIKAKEIDWGDRPNSNLVFLLDVSGSMGQPNKLPLVKKAMRMLVDSLGENDRVAIAVYAGASGLVLDSTPCSEAEKILGSLDRLRSGGSTNGGAGIQLAYKIAQENFIKGGLNRVILCTDGDFNVGTTDQGSLVRMIQQKAKGGVFLTVLGFGMGNYQDATLEKLADKGNGNYGYIDTALEARKVLVNEAGGTLLTVAKDVKIQVEFNPLAVQAYRLIGYENRVMAHRDFNNDKKDAGDIGAGHCVTALYEIVPVGVKFGGGAVDALKYQTTGDLTSASTSGELMNVKLRYKQPDGDTSTLLQVPVRDRSIAFDDTTDDFRFAASVAAYGMILRGSEHKGSASIELVMELSKDAMGNDAHGYRAQFVELVEASRKLLN